MTTIQKQGTRNAILDTIELLSYALGRWQVRYEYEIMFPNKEYAKKLKHKQTTVSLMLNALVRITNISESEYLYRTHVMKPKDDGVDDEKRSMAISGKTPILT